MLPNKYAGEGVAHINGRDVKFKLTLGALGAICTAWDITDNRAVFARLVGSGGMPAFADLPVIVEAMTDGLIDEQEAKNLGPQDLPVICRAIADAVAEAFPKADKADGKKKATKNQTKSRSMNGNVSASDASDIPPGTSGH